MLSRKKSVIFAVSFLSILFSSFFVSSAVCELKQGGCGVGEEVVFWTSGNSNAHVSLSGGPLQTYKWAFCCPEGEPDGSTPIIRISSDSNAHAESPDFIEGDCSVFKDEEICGEQDGCGWNSWWIFAACEGTYGGYSVSVGQYGISCYEMRGSSCDDGENPVLSLSGETNAHVGGPNENNYPVKICCQQGEIVDSTTAQWLDGNGYIVQNDAGIEGIVLGSTTVGMRVVKIDMMENPPIEIEFVVNHLKGGEGIEVFSASKNLEVGETEIEVGWSITQEQWDSVCAGDSECEFYFDVLNENGDSLEEEIARTGRTGNEELFSLADFDCEGILSCEDYGNEGDCESDVCPNTIKGYGVECGICDITNYGETINECACVWSEDLTGEDSSSCSSEYKVVLCGETPLEIGRCEVVQGEVDEDCSDGFMSYDWEGDWEWLNDFGADPTCEGRCEGGCIFGKDESYHCDPDGVAAECETGGPRKIPCPTQVQLPFFDTFNLILTIILIIAIYGVLEIKRRR